MADAVVENDEARGRLKKSASALLKRIRAHNQAGALQRRALGAGQPWRQPGGDFQPGR